MAVIKDVARLADVSISTVSKYFNNPAGLSESYRERVANAVKELNYTPNAIARVLRTKRTNTIALIVPDITNYFFVEVYNHVRSALLEKGYSTQLYICEENVNILSNLLSQFSSAKVDGILLTFLDEDAIVSQLSETQGHTPLALLSWEINNPFNSVVLDLTTTVYNSTKYLIAQGHTKIAYVNGIRDGRSSREKMSGYMRAMAEYNLDVPADYLYFGNYLFRTGYQAAKQYMSLHNPPTGIVAANDILAIGCCKFLHMSGYKVPEDVSVIGMDGIQLGRIYDPSITTMAMPIKEMCHKVVDLLINKIAHPNSKNRQAIYSTKLVIGRSTDAHAPIMLDL